MARSNKNQRPPRSRAPVLVVLVGIGVAYAAYRRNAEQPPAAGPAAEGERVPSEAVAGLTTEWGVAPAGLAAALAPDTLARNIYVVLDGSGSMSERECADGATKAEAAKTALLKFAQAVPAEALLGLLVFDSHGVSERVPLASGNRAAFEAAVRAMEPDGDTPLFRALKLGVERLQAQAIAQRGYGEYDLVVVTDGAASHGEDPTAVVEHLARYTPVTVHTIGFCIDENHALNRPGRTFYQSATRPEDLDKGLTDVLAEAESFDAGTFKP